MAEAFSDLSNAPLLISGIKKHRFTTPIRLGLILFYSCSSKNSDETNGPDKIHTGLDTSSITADHIESVRTRSEEKEDHTTWSIELLKTLVSKGFTSYHMDSPRPELDTIPEGFINEEFSYIRINGFDGWRLRANAYEPVYGFEWEQFGDRILFSVLQDDESCCHTMYLCLADTTGMVLDIKRLALSGADGMWDETCSTHYLGNGEYEVVCISNTADDVIDEIENGYRLYTLTSTIHLGWNRFALTADTLSTHETSKLFSFD